jgi:hypothetical protein
MLLKLIQILSLQAPRTILQYYQVDRSTRNIIADIYNSAEVWVSYG